MEKKINIAELLKNCPKGMELDCAMNENVYFDKIWCDEDFPYPIRCYIIEDGVRNPVNFTKYGEFNTMGTAKCVIYPKGKTTWEGFVPPCEFKDGDIITCTNMVCSFVAIFKEKMSDKLFKNYAILILDNNTLFSYNIDVSDFIKPRFATEEEKERLFQAIKDNGYKWNAETKTLEKLPKFKDGDIIYTKTKSNGKWLSIYKGLDGRNIRTYADICLNDNLRFYCDYVFGNILCYKEEISEQRLATEEEKQKLFQVIKANGFKWNAETKTIKNLVELNFNDGDIIYTKTKGNGKWLSIYKELEGNNIRTYVDISLNNNLYFYCNRLSGNILCLKEEMTEQRLATEEEKETLFKVINNNGYKWNAETKTFENITPKFKVGDIIRHIDTNYIYKILNVFENHYVLDGGSFSFSFQDQYELVPNKFDINTLKPFDKVLARDCSGDKWNINLFGYYRDNGTYQCMTFTKNQCIPYDGNEHLLGTNYDCDEFYKTWE